MRPGLFALYAVRILVVVASLGTPYYALAQTTQNPPECSRIVSLAPSLTEVLFALGLGDRIVGVTRFCRFPEAAQSIDRVGGYLDVNAEVVFSKKPGLVVALRENESTAATLDRIGVRLERLNHDTIQGIQDSIRILGDLCGVSARAQEILMELNERKEQVSLARKSNSQMRALVVVGRMPGSSGPSGVFVSGTDGFYSDILSLLGLKNVNTQKTISIPSLSHEGLLEMNPEVIVEIVNVDDLDPRDPLDFWKQFPKVSAVRRNQVYVVEKDFASIPGPRYIELLELLASRINGSSQPE